MKYKQKLPKDVEDRLDAYIERVKRIPWLKPPKGLKKESADFAIKAAISAFGVSASVEYRKIKAEEPMESGDAAWDAARDAARDAAWGAAWGAARDAAWDAARDAAWGAARDAAWGAAWDAAWDAARDAAWGAAWDAARDAARDAAEILVADLPSYKGKTPFLKLVEVMEMGLLPTGVVDGKFIVYVPDGTNFFTQAESEGYSVSSKEQKGAVKVGNTWIKLVSDEA